MKLTSSCFKEGETIPSLYTCEGKNIPPPLEFSAVPKEAKSLVLIVDDPDVPAAVLPEKMYDHWIVFNILPTTKNFVVDGSCIGTEGKNSSGKKGYTGPCPPRQHAPSEHRYYFKLYALDQRLELPAGISKKEVEQAMKGHVLAQATLMGRYAMAR